MVLILWNMRKSFRKSSTVSLHCPKASLYLFSNSNLRILSTPSITFVSLAEIILARKIIKPRPKIIKPHLTAAPLSRHNNNEKAIEYLEIATRLNPRAADSIRSLGVAYRIQSKKAQGQLAQEYIAKANNCFAKAEQLGVTNLPLNNYIETQRKAQKEFRKNYN